MENLLERYLFMGMSFSTFKFSEVDELCLKYELSHFKYFKNKYLKQIFEIIQKDKYASLIQIEYLGYFIHKEIDAIKNTTLFISPSEKQEKLIKKYLKKPIEISSPFEVSLLPDNLVDKKGTFVFSSRQEMNKYMYLIEKFEHSNLLILDAIMQDDNDEIKKEDLMDIMKLELLKDDADFYFVSSNSIYSNQIINFIFNLNKIGVCL